MKFIFIVIGVFIGILILSIYFEDVSLVTNMLLDFLAGVIVVIGIRVIVETLKKK